ncbi:MAG: sodium:solute symporter, partial [Planctomycetes bacterium]|nr:sodium:solute symporter [Planctomycetota bacterium]
VIFLIQRGLAAGLVIYTPSVVLSALLGWSEAWTIALMGFAALGYTAFGGMRAVLSTDVKQMLVMVVGLIIALVFAVRSLPESLSVGEAWGVASRLGRTTLIDTTWDPTERYTIWSSLIGGSFIFLAYFGCDQSQAQRLLAGRSLRHVRGALALNAVAKIPFQFVVLAIGTLLFVGQLYAPPPPSFLPDEARAIESHRDDPGLRAALDRYDRSRADITRAGATATDDPAAWRRVQELLAEGQRARVEVRGLAIGLRDGEGSTAASEPAELPSETNYVFPRFIIEALPVGLVGLLFAAIFAAALSSIDSELNAMATVWSIDIWHFAFRGGTSAHEVRESRVATVAIGLAVTACAYWFSRSTQFGSSVIEAVNNIGAYFYGSILGVFVLAFTGRRANGHGAFVGLLAGMSSVALLDAWPAIHEAIWGEPVAPVAFLYFTTVGTVATVITGWIVSAIAPGRSTE